MKHFFRRLQQAKNIIFDTDIKNYHLELSQRYESLDELKRYRDDVETGLHPHEKIFFHQIFKKIKHGSSILIVGSGFGREAFAFEKMGYHVTGIDISQGMVSGAQQLALKKNKHSQFYCSDLITFKACKTYDFIFICTSIMNFIPHSENRIFFLKKANALLKINGILSLETDIFKYSGIHRYALASYALKFKYKSWQQGDTLRSFYGNHTKISRPLFYHFYPTHRHVEKELKAAQFTKIERCEDFFWGEKIEPLA